MFAERAEVKMWSACLLNAVKEYHGMIIMNSPKEKPTKAEIRASVKEWFCSNNQGIGSFLFICETLEIDPNLILDKLDEPETLHILKKVKDAKRRQNI